MKTGEGLRLLRIVHDLQQNELAELVGISKSYISELERDQKSPSLEVLDRFSKVFELPLSAMLYFIEVSQLPVGSEPPPMVDEKTLNMISILKFRTNRKKK